MVNEFIVKNGLITPQFQLNGMNYPITDGSNGQFLRTDGAGNLSFATVSGGGGGGTSERLRVNYTGNSQLSTIDDITAGISLVNIIDSSSGVALIDITFTGHSNPPTSIMVYGYSRVPPEIYSVRQIGANIGGTAQILAGGDPATAFGSFAGPLTLTVTKAITGAFADGLGETTHAYVIFQFGD